MTPPLSFTTPIDPGRVRPTGSSSTRSILRGNGSSSITESVGIGISVKKDDEDPMPADELH